VRGCGVTNRAWARDPRMASSPCCIHGWYPVGRGRVPLRRVRCGVVRWTIGRERRSTGSDRAVPVDRRAR
jgi:hypothetical protein